jgi:hypothetical protein
MGSSVIVILNTALSRSQSELAYGVPFLDSEMKFLEVDRGAGDRTEKKIKPRETCQRATARFVAVYRFHGTGKIVNPMVENKI